MKKFLIDIKNVSLKAMNEDNLILSDIHYQVAEGDFVVVLGSNGSGKSSLLKLLDRRYTATEGHIDIADKTIGSYSVGEYSHLVVTLTQNFHESLFTSLTIFENFLLTKIKAKQSLFTNFRKADKEIFAEYIKAYNPKLADKMDTLVEHLSGGEKQALALALCVYYPPKILLLDEHTSALDPKTGADLMELTQRVIAKHNITCLLTTHDLSIANQYGNRILALKNGKIYQAIEHNEKNSATEKELFVACY